MVEEIILYASKLAVIVVQCISEMVAQGKVDFFADVAVKASCKLVPVSVDRDALVVYHAWNALY